MLLLNPVKVHIHNLGDLGETELELDVPYSPKDPSMGSRRLRLTKSIYVDAADFRTEDNSPDYFRLAPGKTVGLLHVPFPLRAESFTEDETTGEVTDIHASLVRDSDKDTPTPKPKPKPKPKTYIQWVPDCHWDDDKKQMVDDHLWVKVRTYGPLFKSQDPTAAEGGIISDLAANSKREYRAMVEEDGFHEVKRRALEVKSTADDDKDDGDDNDLLIGPECVRFQGMRVGYFVSTPLHRSCVTTNPC